MPRSQPEPRTILFLGVGELGGRVLDLFCLNSKAEHRLIAAGRDLLSVARRANTSLLVATQMGRHPRLESTQIDIDDVDAAAASIARIKPDLIFTSVTRQPWWALEDLPRPARDALAAAEFGPWLPFHLAPVANVMEAVVQSQVEVPVVNAAYPDVVNTVLTRAGRGPLVGIGNVANPVPALRHAAGLEAGVSVETVKVHLTATRYVSHRLTRIGNAGGAPFSIRVEIAGRDETANLDVSHLLSLLPSRFPRIGGRSGQTMAAAAAVQVLEAILSGHPKEVHAPGPHGLPGGYPLKIIDGRLEVITPLGTTVEASVNINCEALRFDGVEAIDPDGTVHFTDEHAGVLERELNYSTRAVSLRDVHGYADELAQKFQEFKSCLANTAPL